MPIGPLVLTNVIVIKHVVTNSCLIVQINMLVDHIVAHQMDVIKGRQDCDILFMKIDS